MLDALRTDQQIREILNQLGLTLHNDHFEAGVMIEMRMDRRDD